LGVHLETALRGVVIGERWPKSAVEVVITVLEGEEDGFSFFKAGGGAGGGGGTGGWGMMNVLAGCITVAGAALVDAGIDCVDLISGGVAAVVVSDAFAEKQKHGTSSQDVIVLDPSPAEHSLIRSACVVAYLASRDEITEMWMKGEVGGHAEVETLLDSAVQAARLTRTVLMEAVRESAEAKIGGAPALEGKSEGKSEGRKDAGREVVMKE
jgi:exosome complex component MTR3